MDYRLACSRALLDMATENGREKRRSLAVILAGVVVCIVFSGYCEPVLLVGIFLMNCTMPITLYLANVLLPGREGLAFGLLAAALIPGYLLAVYW